MLPDDGEPRHRPAYGPATAQRAGFAAEPHGAARKLGGDFRAVRAVPADWRAAVRLLSRSGPAPTGRNGPHLPRISVAESGAGSGRDYDCRDSGGGHGEPERGAEFVSGDDGGGFFSKPRPPGSG